MAPVQTDVNHIGTPPNEPFTILVTSIDDELTDDYSVTLEYDFEFWIEKKIITVSNQCSANDLNYTIYGAISAEPIETDWYVLVGPGGVLEEQTVVCETNDYQVTVLEWRHLRVMCKNDKAGDTSKAKVEVRSTRKP